MKNIIKYFSCRLFVVIACGGAALSLIVNAHAASDDAEAVFTPPNYSLAGSAYCADEPYGNDKAAIECTRLNMVALNSIATRVDWELGSASMFSYGSNVGESNLITSPKALPADGASVVSAAKPDSSAITEVNPAAPSASLSLDENMRGDIDTRSDNTISEPLLTSILALIAIVAVARRNVSGV